MYAAQVAKRHRMEAGNWESIFGRLEELVLANSGENEFDEIFKLLVAKLYAELHLDSARFAACASPHETAQRLNGLIALAADRWRGILPASTRSHLTDEHLLVCVEAIQEHSLCDTSLEVLDGAFEYLVSRAAKGAKGQYFTPRQVIDCCVRIVDPRPGELVADPACGSAGFLIHSFLHVAGKHPDLDMSDYCATSLWGFDFDQRAIQVAKALMLVSGDGHANLFRLNSLLTSNGATGPLDVSAIDDAPALTIEDVARSRTRSFRGFDVILTNPPFAGEIREKALLDAYALNSGARRLERDVLFMERCVRLLRPGGRLAIVLPHNKLGTARWSYARDWLIRNMQVVAVLGLDRNMFLPHTHQKADIVFAIKRERPLRTVPMDESILFLISESGGKDSKGRTVEREGTTSSDPAWIRADHDLDHLVDAFKAFAPERAAAWGPR